MVLNPREVDGRGNNLLLGTEKGVGEFSVRPSQLDRKGRGEGGPPQEKGMKPIRHLSKET